jgi:hypothetical protein
MLAVLAVVPDPRARRGVPHGVVAVPAIGVCAVLAGARMFTAIAEWAHALTLRCALGRDLVGWRPVSQRSAAPCRPLMPKPLMEAVSAWLLTRSATPAAASTVRAIAIDGKSARGVRGPGCRAVHLLATFGQASGVVMGQTVG